MFTTDRDLLILEPNAFRDAAFLAQRIGSGTAGITDAVLTVSGINLVKTNVIGGMVAIVDGLPVEILARTGASTASVSLLRPNLTDSAIFPPDVTGKPLVISSFAPQRALVHAQLLRLLGMDPDAPADPSGDTPTEADIVNPRALWLVEALGTLHLIYSAAAALHGPSSPLGARADMYAARLSAERQRAVALIDTNADGQPDVVRRLNVLQFVRQ